MAGTAPSGAHRQPWRFVAIGDPELKRQLRERVEEEERKFYEERITDEWAEALRPLGTDFVNEHITTAPGSSWCFEKITALPQTVRE